MGQTAAATPTDVGGPPRPGHPRLADGLVTTTLLVIAALTLTDRRLELSALHLVLAMAGTFLQAGALLYRRRHPLMVLAVTAAVLLVTVAGTGDSVAADVGVVFALYAVASRRAAVVVWAAWVIVLAVVFGGYWLLARLPGAALGSRVWDDLAAAGIGLLLVSLGALALGLTVQNRRVRMSALHDRVAQLALERDQREQLAAAAERARMAREMHDVVAHSVAVMVTLAHGATAALDTHPERSRRALTELSSTGRAALADMHRIVGLLRDGQSPDQPTVGTGTASVAELLATFRQDGLPLQTVERGPALPDDPGIRHAVYRILQECLTNVLRHAPDSRAVQVTIDRAPDHVTLVVADETAHGAAASGDSGGRGLVGIRERAAAYGGTVEAGPTDGGWKVRATLPYPEGES